jgi:ribosomal protein S18 acetylase RimI-like enzyme
VEGVSPAVTLGKAQPEDAEALAAISQRAFDSDATVGAPGPGGPPGYASPAWQARVMETSDYHVILVDRQVAGGAIVFATGPGEYELSRIFIDPQWHDRGIGRRAIALIWEAYPQARRWTLDTPAWNRRTRHFYESLGFVAIGEKTGPDLVIFERRVDPHPRLD